MLRIYRDGDNRFVLVIDDAKTLADVVEMIAKKYEAPTVDVPELLPPEEEAPEIPDVSDLIPFEEPAPTIEEPTQEAPKLSRRQMIEKLTTMYASDKKPLIDGLLKEKDLPFDKAMYKLPDTTLREFLGRL